MILLHKNDLSAPTIQLILEANLVCKQALWGALAVGGEKEGELATTSLEVEYLHQKSRCEMLIGGDDISNDVITLGTCFSMFVLHSRSFPLHADWRKSDSSVDGEPQGNWRRNSNSGDVVASSPSFSRPAARAPRRACSQAKANRKTQILLPEYCSFPISAYMTVNRSNVRFVIGCASP